jgi:hypothetical protein
MIVFIDGLLENMQVNLHVPKKAKQLLEQLSKCQLLRRTLLCPLVGGWLDKCAFIISYRILPYFKITHETTDISNTA